jgi:hypothetical protein
MQVIEAKYLNVDDALEIVADYSQRGRHELVKSRREQLAHVGIYAGYPFKGWGCTACYNTIVSELYNGELKARLLRKTSNKSVTLKEKSTMTKYKLTELGRKKKGFQKMVRGVGIQIVKIDDLTDKDVDEIVKAQPFMLGLFFEKVETKKKPAPKKEDKTENN